jgi:hypothetical protein
VQKPPRAAFKPLINATSQFGHHQRSKSLSIDPLAEAARRVQVNKDASSAKKNETPDADEPETPGSGSLTGFNFRAKLSGVFGFLGTQTPGSADRRPASARGTGPIGAFSMENTLIKKRFAEIKSECFKKGVRYIDEDFKPTVRSLVDSWTQRSKDVPWEHIDWVRATDVPAFLDEQGNRSIMGDDVSPYDVEAGALGNYYFLSALSALADKPHRVRALLGLDQLNDQGILSVALYKNGRKQEIIIDDHFPCRDSNPVFAKAKGKHLWVSMLEKAWAKVHGSYERIAQGYPQNVLRDLTGAPSFNISVSEPGLIDQLIMFNQAGYIMTASRAETESLSAMSQYAYQLVSVLQILDQNMQPVLLIQLRNPWGTFEWDGAWSATSDNWTPQLMEEVGWKPEHQDGKQLFFMSFDDFCGFFN